MGAALRIGRPSEARGRARVFARSEGARELTKARLAEGAAAYPPSINAAHAHTRPKTLGDCERAGLGRTQPCPWSSCRWHLALDVDARTGSIKHNFPHLDVDEMPETCALACAARGPALLEEIGAAMNLQKEAVRVIETRALAALRRHLPVFAEVELPAARVDPWDALDPPGDVGLRYGRERSRRAAGKGTP